MLKFKFSFITLRGIVIIVCVRFFLKNGLYEKLSGMRIFLREEPLWTIKISEIKKLQLLQEFYNI